MSWEATAWARRSMKKMGKGVKPAQRLLLLLLSDTADEEGLSWPSVKTLALECGCSDRSVQRNIDQLVELGLIETMERRAANGRQQSNLYRIKMDADLPPAALNTPDDNLSPPPRQIVTPQDTASEGVKMSPPTPSFCRGEGDRAMSPLEQSLESNTHSHPAPVHDFSPHYGAEPMSPQWEPNPNIVVPSLQRSAIPEQVAQLLAQDPELVNAFRNHQLTTPGRVSSTSGWNIKLATWLQRDWQRLGRPATPMDYRNARGFNHAANSTGYRTSPTANQRDQVHAASSDWQDTSWADGLI